MKLLFDQNITHKLFPLLQDYFEEVEHVRNIGFKTSDDYDIWKYAKDNNFTIITKDSDFFDFSNIYGSPPKIIWLRCGNTSTERVFRILKNNLQNIIYFIKKSKLSCLEIYDF